MRLIGEYNGGNEDDDEIGDSELYESLVGRPTLFFFVGGVCNVVLIISSAN